MTKFTHLTFKQRSYIEIRTGCGDSQRSIAKVLNVSPSTVNREYKRNIDSTKYIYEANTASIISKNRKRLVKLGENKIQECSEVIKNFIIDNIKIHTSPEVISALIMKNFHVLVSKNTIYNFLKQEFKVGNDYIKYLPHRGKAYKYSSDASTSKIKNRIGIENRPKIADQKTEIGHYEIDTVVGKDHCSYLLTLVDKCSKLTIIRKLKDKCASTVVDAFKDIVQQYNILFKTITSDNGTEFAYHESISKLTNANFYFANPYSSWERGLNEHTNGLIRRFFPKGTDFHSVSESEIAKVECILNNRARKSLGYKSPNQMCY